MDDRAIIDLYWKRDEQAISETQRAYGGYCFTVANSILGNSWDAEEVVSDTWIHAWNSIPPKRPTYLKQFLAKITRNLALNIWSSQNAEKRKCNRMDVVLDELGECIPSNASVDTNLDGEELKHMILNFLKRESRRERYIFLRRYFYFDEIHQIAQECKLTDANVYQILSRVRGRLKKYLQKEGYSL